MREVESGDQDQVEALLREFHARSAFGRAEFSKEKFQKLAAQVLDKKPTSLAAVAVQHDWICGFIWVSVAEYILSREARIGTVRLLIVDQVQLSGFVRAKTALRLIALAKDWGSARNASALVLNFSGGVDPDVSDKISKQAGGIPFGENYIVVIQSR